MKTKFIYIALLLMAVFLNYEMRAQNFNDVLRLSDPEILTSARALSMGNAYTAISNDFSASLFNPAGLGLIKKGQFSGGLQYNSLKNDASLFSKSTNYSSSSTKFNQFGFTFPLPTYRGSLVLGFGYNEIKNFNRAVKFNGYNGGNHSLIQDLAFSSDDIAYELGLSYPVYDGNNKYLYDETVINGKLNQSGNIIQDGSLNSWVFSGAVEIQKDLFVGASINIINGDFKRNREYWEDDDLNIYNSSILLDASDPNTADFKSFYMNDVIKWDVSGWSSTLGVLGKVDENISFGFTIKLPKKLTVKETYLVEGDASFGTGKTYYLDPPIENHVEYEVTTPYELTGGATYSIQGVTLSFDANYIDYTTAEFSKGFDLHSRENKNKDIVSEFTDVINLNAGVEYVLPGTGIALRGGFILMPSPYKGDSSGYDKKFITAGFGFISKGRISFDVAYAYGWWKDFGDNYGSNLSRFYQDITKSNLLLGVKYNF